MADSFQMDPRSAGTGLTGAGRSRSAPAARGVPALPVGSYINSYSSTAAAVLATLGVELTGTVGFGVATAASSVASTDATEAANQASLTT